MAFDLVSYFKEGDAHGDAYFFGFCGTSNDTAIVIGKDDNGLVVEAGVKAAFTRGIEVITIGKCNELI